MDLFVVRGRMFMPHICSSGADLKRGDPERCGREAKWQAQMSRSKAVLYACSEEHKAEFDEVLHDLHWTPVSGAGAFDQAYANAPD